MKMKVEFADHDEYDDLVRNLADLAVTCFANEWDPNGVGLVKLLHRLLDGEIVEP